MGVLALCLVLHPGSGWYPACPIHAASGLLCPGCGGTRALSALLRGDVAGGLQANALVVFGLPWMLLYGAAVYLRAMRGVAAAWPTVPRAALWVAGGATLLFTLTRNLARL